MIKILWLTQYNVIKLLPEIKLNREVVLHSSSWIHSLSEQLVLNKEIELHIITHSHLVNESQVIKKKNICFHVIKYSFPFTNRGFPWYVPIDKLTAYYSFSKRAQKIINIVKPDVLHIHGTEGGYFIPALKTKIPCIISIQGIINEIVKVEPSISSYIQSFYERFAIRKGKYFGCRTNFDFNYVTKNNTDAVIFDLPEAINNVFFAQQWLPEKELSLLFVGSILKRKGIEDLIQALFKLKPTFPQIKLRIVGSGPKNYIKHLNQVIKNYNLQSNIIWLGTKSPSEVAAELSKCSLFVLPSLIDNSPNCLAEAMAVGVPSIATRVGGIPSMVEDKFDALLYEKHDIDGLVKLIEEIVSNKVLQNRLSRNARERVLNRNFPLNVTQKYIDVYKSIKQ